MKITYAFKLESGLKQSFAVDLDRSLRAESAPGEGAPWTRLAFHQCPHCPLRPEQSPHCPPARDLEEVVAGFISIISHQRATVAVETPERTVSKDCDVQTGLRSLFGLIMATSGCPILSQLRGLAQLHLPFQTMEETAFRSVGAYLVGQLLAQHAGQAPDWSLAGLKALMKDLVILDTAFKARIDAAAEKDATMNAIAELGVLTGGVQFLLEEQLDEVAPFTLPPAARPQNSGPSGCAA